MFLVKLLKFGQNFCPNGHVVSFLRQKQWWSDTWCPENHPAHTHRRVLACVPLQHKIKQISIFANLLSTNIDHKNQQNNVLTHMQTTPTWLKLSKQKSLFIPVIFEAESAVAKCNHQSQQCSYTDLN